MNQSVSRRGIALGQADGFGGYKQPRSGYGPDDGRLHGAMD